MSPLYCFEFVLFSFCVNLFTIFSYFVYYSDMLYSNVNIQKEYDYIIVGSGTAGSLIAHRLATETNHSFIVLEAGGHSHPWLEVPVLAPFLHRSVFDWSFESVPQHACAAMDGHICRLPQGKIVGGSAKLNNMIHVRGNISHYVNWFNGKRTKEYIEKQFKYIENNIIQLDDIQYQSELSDSVLEVAKELGYKTINADFAEGFMKTKLSQKEGKRWTMSDNLHSKHIITNAYVEKVFFNGNTATGISVEIFGNKHNLHARKGVILSAGAINTPKLLQLSGIGPESVLKSVNIPVVKVLPVGENLQDHVATGLDLVIFEKPVSVQTYDMINPVNAFEYFFNGRGPLTTSGCDAIGFVSTKNDEIPDIQFMVLPVGLSSDRGSLFSKNLGIKQSIWEKYFAKNVNKYVATILPVLLHPKSKGIVSIKSKDPKNPPVYDPKYFSNQEDVITLVNGLKVMMKLLETNAMRRLGVQLNKTPFPGCENEDLFSDSYLECYVKHLTLTSYHPIGTCSMGLPESTNTVVDLDFKVLGIKKLYVADASVLPTLPSGNINAAVAMMANIFFDTNIGAKSTKKDFKKLCYKKDYFYKHLLNVPMCCKIVETLHKDYP